MNHKFSTAAAQHSEIMRLVSSMEVHAMEIANFDLGAGIFLKFYDLESSLQEENTGFNQVNQYLVIRIFLIFLYYKLYSSQIATILVSSYYIPLKNVNIIQHV